jgi:hypothetical protein
MVSPWVIDRKCQAGIGGYYSQNCSAVTGHATRFLSTLDGVQGEFPGDRRRFDTCTEMPFILSAKRIADHLPVD